MYCMNEYSSINICTVVLYCALNKFLENIQGLAKRLSPGLVNFVTALAYHSCLALPAAFTQPTTNNYVGKTRAEDSI